MNPKIKAKWVAALRSGKYIQGGGCLKEILDESPSHCCLGVLCELAVIEKLSIKVSQNYNQETFDGRSDVLPTSVMVWAGLTEANPRVGDTTIAELNDNCYSFAEIADIIERRL